jgi:mannitol/fructose-specific phosphotransferase system IIA component (Ntr-type)
MAAAADAVFGHTGEVVITIAALLAFFSVANAGILASSRYPLAMGRDNLVPEALCRVSPRGAPLLSIVLTVSVVVAIILFLDPLKIAKLASAFQLMMFALLCLAVIIMRESGLDSYDPGYKAPLYPWLPLFGLMAPFVLIFQMGWMPTLFSFALIVAGVGLYQGYGRKQVERRGAIFHVFAKLGESRHDPLDTELRSILKEKGLREQDPFEEVVLSSTTLDLDEAPAFEDLVQRVATAMALRTGHLTDVFVRGFTEGTLHGATPVSKGVALPHMRMEDLAEPYMVLVRTRQGMHFLAGDVFGKTAMSDDVHAFFFLVSPESEPNMHLRMLAQLATRIDQDDFLEKWMAADGEMQLREVFLRDDRYASVRVGQPGPAEDWTGRTLRELGLPDGCLVAAIRRNRRTLVPRGNTALEDQDRLLVFGEPEAIAKLYDGTDGAPQA